MNRYRKYCLVVAGIQLLGFVVVATDLGIVVVEVAVVAGTDVVFVVVVVVVVVVEVAAVAGTDVVGVEVENIAAVVRHLLTIKVFSGHKVHNATSWPLL